MSDIEPVVSEPRLPPRWFIETIGRRTGQKRKVMVRYFEDGPNFVTMAMNGWGEAEPA